MFQPTLLVVYRISLAHPQGAGCHGHLMVGLRPSYHGFRGSIVIMGWVLLGKATPETHGFDHEIWGGPEKQKPMQ